MTANLLAWTGILMAMVYLPMSEERADWLRSVVKTLPLLLFAYAAWHFGGGPFLVAGLFLSALGDMALSREGEQPFLFGLAAFALAHLLYILHFLGLSDSPVWEAFVANAPMAIFLVAYAALAEIWLIPYTRHLKWAVRVYVVLITGMGLAALTMPMGVPFLGAAFFILSDTLLAFQLFRMDEDNPLSGRMVWAIWIAYVAGQALILSTA
ncbi:lysoplasmalogenase [Maritimibacter sp. DP1N21-5]|uniref:lysoplasmalogenase n=1 Tax=Maritimibacter sp. DP1N21-5 TaxID=2836867 RepID=UPI001C459706|nr:lysoplasmalogenase [Maritimibacter sp. DP1N21-5]MBV7410786.1 lysoplasmalogenase [Maritimibacter sp. DP1N21-5]